jgi:hypothetical protein
MRQTGLRWKGCSWELTTVYGYNSPDCPVVHRTVRWVICDELIAPGNEERRRGYNSQDCLVSQRSPAPMVSREIYRRRMAAPTVGRGHRTVWCALGQCLVRQQAQSCNGRLCSIWKEIAHRTATVTVWWCTGLSGAPPDRMQVWPSKLASNGS